MNNKGFTLIELLATIVLLVLVITVSTYAVTNVIGVSDKKNWDILVSNIESACEVYYQEKLSGGADDIGWFDEPTNTYNVSVGELLNNGYLITDQTKENGNTVINAVINPVTDESINGCELSISYNTETNRVVVVFDEGDTCPDKETGK